MRGTDPGRRVRSPRTAAGIAAIACVVLALGVMPGRAQVTGGSVFTGTASTRLIGFDVMVSPTIGFDPLVDAGASVAEAQLNSRGNSSSFAATPYPGTAVITLPGTVSVLTQGEIPADQIPDYPLYADSSFPTNPSEHLQAGLYDLMAESNTADSHARATDGQTVGTARVTNDPGSRTVVARAEASVAAIQIGPLLTLNGVRSFAEVRQVAGGELERNASFEVASLTVAGQRVAITEDGLSLLGTDVPLAGVVGQTLAPLLTQLAAAGTTVEVLPEQELEDGVSSGGLRITTTQAAPPGISSGIDTVTVVFTIGSSIASVSNRALPPTGGGAVTPVARPPTAAPTGAAVSGGSGSVTPSRPATLPSSGPLDPSVAASPAATVDPTLVASIPLDVSAFGFYPVLIIAGAALFAAARLFPYLGGRSTS